MLCSKQCPHPVEQSPTCILFWRHELLTLSRIMSPANSRRWTNAGLMYAGLMLGQRRQRWPNIKPALVQRLVFAGIIMYTGVLSQQTRRWPDAGLMLTQRRRRPPSTTLAQHWVNVSCLMGSHQASYYYIHGMGQQHTMSSQCVILFSFSKLYVYMQYYIACDLSTQPFKKAIEPQTFLNLRAWWDTVQ